MTRPSLAERVIDQGADLLLIMIGVWLVDQGLDAVQFGWANTFLISLGLDSIIGPIMYKLRN